MATAEAPLPQPPPHTSPPEFQQQQEQQQTAGLSRWVPSLPTIDLAALNPFATTNDAAKLPAAPDTSSPEAATATQSNKRSFLSTLSMLSPQSATTNAAPAPAPTPDREPSPTPSTAMFAEPETRATSEDGESPEGSIADGGRRSRARSNRPKTRYSLCHPPPTGAVKARLHRRPRSLLQLHKLYPNAHPKPAYEVVPSANFSGRLTKTITKVFKAKHGLCPNDVVVLRAEKYGTVDDEEDGGQEERDVIGLICRGRRNDENLAKEGKAKICMASGSEWEAYPLLNGGYEFFTTDEHGLGLTVRWVPKKNRDGSKTAKDGSKRFNFSTINPNSRRHPIIASLSKTKLEINDVYIMPNSSGSTPMSTPRQRSSVLADDSDDDTFGKEQRATDDLLRELIAVTGIWVNFKEGWSPSFKYEGSAPTVTRAASAMSASPSKSVASPLSTPPASPVPSQSQLQKRASIKSLSSSILRKSSLMRQGNRVSSASVPENAIALGATMESRNAENAATAKAGGRPRGESTSTVLVNRSASYRRKNQQATWRPDLLSARENQLRETSRENVTATATATTPRAQPSRRPQSEIWTSSSQSTPKAPRPTSLLATPLIPTLTVASESEVEEVSVPTTDNHHGTSDTQRNSSGVPKSERTCVSHASSTTAVDDTGSQWPARAGSGDGGRKKKKGRRGSGGSAERGNSRRGKNGKAWKKLLCGIGAH